MLVKANSSLRLSDVLSAVILTTLISTGNACPASILVRSKVILYSFWYASALLPVIVSGSSKTLLKPAPWYWICIFNWTEDPNKSPWSVAFWSWGNVIVTFAASTLVLVIWRVTGADVVTVVPTPVVDSLLTIPEIWVWFAVPSLKAKLTFWKLKSAVAGDVLLALALRIGVSFKNISFCAALL